MSDESPSLLAIQLLEERGVPKMSDETRNYRDEAQNAGIDEIEELLREDDRQRRQIKLLEEMNETQREVMKTFSEERDKARTEMERWKDIYNHLGERFNDMTRQRDEAVHSYERACKTIAQMHRAAVGEVTGPRRGVVEDVEDLRAERDKAVAHIDTTIARLDLVIARLDMVVPKEA